MKITNKIHMLKIPFSIPVSGEKKLERFVYLYIICGKNIYLIDTGTSIAKEIIYNYLETIGRKPGEIKAVFLTHSHPDHIGPLNLINKDTGCVVYAHKAESGWIEDVKQQFKERPVPGFHSLVAGSCKIDHYLNDGDIVTLEEDITLEIIHTPGHSDGSVSILYREEDALFTGDAVMLPGELPIYTNVKAYLQSIEMLKKIKPDLMLSAWDMPRKGSEIETTLDNSMKYILRIDDIVKEIYNNNKEILANDLCKLVLKQLGIPEFVANPLLEKSFAAHLIKM